MDPMSSILDIDLDYFNLMESAIERLRDLLAWAGLPVSIVVGKHHHAFRKWRALVRRGDLPVPGFILHVDEHHDMMDERRSPNLANFMYHVMRQWPACRVHWLVESPIDHPRHWLSDESWREVGDRFSRGRRIPHSWPKPDLVSVSTSPGFVVDPLRCELLTVIEERLTRRSRAGRGRKEGPSHSW